MPHDSSGRLQNSTMSGDSARAIPGRDAGEPRSLPFHVGVLADLTGHPTESRPKLRDRSFVEISSDRTDAVLASLQPHLKLSVENMLVASGDGGMLHLELHFRRLADFSPDAVARQVEPLRELLHVRTRLVGGQGTLDAIEEDKRAGVADRLAQIDGLLSRQLDQILHHPEFQRLEATWRGLKYLSSQIETSDALRIKVLDVSKKELLRDLQRAPDFDQSLLFRKVHEEELGATGGIPFAALVGDYDFGGSAQDVELLEGLSRVAAATYAPFIAAAEPGLFDVSSFAVQDRARDLHAVFSTVEYARWSAFRRTAEARYVVLTCPRVLLRAPYGPGESEQPVDAFDYREQVDGATREDYLWGSAAWALAACVTRAFARHGWGAAIRGAEGGGLVEGLPVHDRRTPGGAPVTVGPTVWSLDDKWEFELSTLGFAALVSTGKSGAAVFFSVPSVQQPEIYDEPMATDAARMAAQLPYVLAMSRYAHLIQAMVRQYGGHVSSSSDAREWLNRWIQDHVASPGDSSVVGARRPLAEAYIDVSETEDRPGAYRVVAFLRPAFQLDALPFSLRLVVDLPSMPGTGASRTIAVGATVGVEEAQAGSLTPLRLLDSLVVPHPGGDRRIEIFHGDLADMRPEDRVDVLVVSAFPNTYTPNPGTLIAALHERGVSVEELSRRGDRVDLRGSFSCWLSGELGDLPQGLHFRRILCFEPRMRGSPPEVVGDIFRSLAPFLGGPDALRTVAMPLIACGNQMSTVGEILEPLLDAAVHWMSLGLPLERLKIVENRGEKAIELQRLFGALRHKYEAITPTAGVHRYDLFVSYAHADVAAATGLVDEMQADWPDLRIFFDRRSLDTGVAWQQEIFEAIDASRRVVALYSPAYLASKVCKEEFNIALFRQRESEELVLFPLFLYSAPLPTYMRLVQFADCREGRRDELRRAGARLVSGLLGPPSRGSPAVL
jgi:type VI secretion system protein ImpC